MKTLLLAIGLVCGLAACERAQAGKSSLEETVVRQQATLDESAALIATSAKLSMDMEARVYRLENCVQLLFEDVKAISSEAAGHHATARIHLRALQNADGRKALRECGKPLPDEEPKASK